MLAGLRGLRGLAAADTRLAVSAGISALMPTAGMGSSSADRSL
jgi:hypothetical protein